MGLYEDLTAACAAGGALIQAVEDALGSPPPLGRKHWAAPAAAAARWQDLARQAEKSAGDREDVCAALRDAVVTSAPLAPHFLVGTTPASVTAYLQGLAKNFPGLRSAFEKSLLRLMRLRELCAPPPAGAEAPASEPALPATGTLAAPLRRRKRRRATAWKDRPLTPAQVEAMSLVGEHKGNVAAAARAAGKSHQAMSKLYNKALKKLGQKAPPKAKTRRLPRDERGQETVESS
jgi:hypothetical protein